MNISFIYILEILGTIVFAITGSVKAVRYKLDFLGVVVMACIVGTAGGIIRDVLLQTTVVAYEHGEYLIISAITGVIVFFTSPYYTANKWKIIRYFDAVGLGLFTAIGASKGATLGVSSVGIVLSGLFTATGGGVLRDMLTGGIPVILTSDFYAMASVIGGICYLILNCFEIDNVYKLAICTILVTTLRFIAMKYNIHLPRAKDIKDENVL